MSVCQNPICGVETTNPKYCCNACAAKVNNTLFPKRSKKVPTCKVCGIELNGRRTTCDEHNPSFVDWSRITYAQLYSKKNYKKNSRIRELARNIYYKSNKPRRCVVCGYDKHFHVCHIKPVSSFSGDTPISVVNDIENLTALCPNHHWEFDNELLIL